MSGERRDTDLLRAWAIQQAGLAELGLVALGDGGLQTLFDRAAVLVAQTLRVEFSAVLELVPQDDRLGLRAGVGWRDGMVGQATLGLDRESLAGFALSRDEPVVVEDFAAETRLRVPELMSAHDVRSGVGVVIHGRDRPGGTEPWGTLSAYSLRARSFTEDEVNFLHTVANTLALVVERKAVERELRGRHGEIARLAEQVARLADDRRRAMAELLDAEERTRERISQLLHDEVLQSLLTARQDLAAAAASPAADDHVAPAREAVVAAIGELRHAVAALHPVTLERRGLRSAIEAAADLYGAGGGFDLTLDLGPRTADARDRLLASLAEELLHNVAQHAEADHVAVTLRREDGDLVFEVADDGRGMDPARPRRALEQGHIGLASMARRVESFGGRFELKSEPGGGTRARVVLPGESAPRSPSPVAGGGASLSRGIDAQPVNPAGVGWRSPGR